MRVVSSAEAPSSLRGCGSHSVPKRCLVAACGSHPVPKRRLVSTGAVAFSAEALFGSACLPWCVVSGSTLAEARAFPFSDGIEMPLKAAGAAPGDGIGAGCFSTRQCLAEA